MEYFLGNKTAFGWSKLEYSSICILYLQGCEGPRTGGARGLFLPGFGVVWWTDWAELTFME